MGLSLALLTAVDAGRGVAGTQLLVFANDHAKLAADLGRPGRAAWRRG